MSERTLLTLTTRVRWAMAAMAMLITACGGGGGGTGNAVQATPPDPFPDGLGATGQLAATFGTTLIEVRGSAQVNCPNSLCNPVTVVWFDERAGMATPLWQRTGKNAVWSNPEPVPSLAVSTATFRVNNSGFGVLGVTSDPASPPKVLRYDPSHFDPWDTQSWDVPLSYGQPLLDRDSDLAVTSGDRVILSRPGPATFAHPGDRIHAYRVLVLRNYAWETLLETPPFSRTDSNQLASLAMNPRGTGIFFWMVGETQPNGQRIFTLQTEFVDVRTPFTWGRFASFEGRYIPCRVPQPMKSATSPFLQGVLAMLHRRSEVSEDCNLDMIRTDFDSRGNFLTAQRLNSEGTKVSEPPTVAVDQDGNALVIWTERALAGPSFRVMWSQSLPPGAWSTARPLIEDTAGVGVPSELFQLTFEMSPDGRAAAALKTLKMAREYIALGYYTHATGWSWRLVANMTQMGPPGVAMNYEGKKINGILMYSAAPCERLPTFDLDGLSTQNCKPSLPFAMWF